MDSICRNCSLITLCDMLRLPVVVSNMKLPPFQVSAVVASPERGVGMAFVSAYCNLEPRSTEAGVDCGSTLRHMGRVESAVTRGKASLKHILSGVEKAFMRDCSLER